MKYNIPEVGTYELNTIVLDLNGTLSVDGKISNETKEKLQALRKLDFTIHLLTGDQRNTATVLCHELNMTFHKAVTAEEKGKFMKKLNCEETVAIGNARIDIETFKQAKLAIATLQAEGIHTAILPYVDIVVPSIENALDLLLDENTLAATMRT